MLKQVGLLACLSLIETVVSFPLLRRDNSTITNSTSTNTTAPAARQRPFLFELTRGAPYTKNPRIPDQRLEKRENILLTHVTDQYFLKLNIAGQDRYLHVDTGSKTTWVADPDFNCYNIHNQLIGNACCGLGETLRLPVDNATTSPFYQSYGSGEYAKGNLTTAQVNLGGVSWPVTLGVADNMRFEGSRIEAGVLGLAGPGLLMGDKDAPTASRAQPFFSQWTSEFSSLPNFFTLGLSRLNTLGASIPSYIEFGGRLIRAPGIETTGSTAIVSLLTVPEPILGRAQPIFGNRTDLVADWTTLDPDYKVGGNIVNAAPLPFHTITDSGAPGLKIPSAVAYEFNKLWIDTRVYANANESSWDIFEEPEVDCASVSPSLTVVFNEIDFTIDGRDLRHVGSDGVCRSLVSGSRSVGVLGVPFLKNVVAVHNLGAKRIEFTARVPY